MNVLMHMILTAEILTMLICMYRIYGERIRADKKTITVFFSTLMMMEMINIYQLEWEYIFLVYLAIFIYCIAEFKGTISETLVSLILWMIVMTVMQMIGAALINAIVADADLRDAIVNMVLLGVVSLIPPQNGLHKLKKILCRHRKFVMISMGLIGLVVAAALLHIKIYRVIHLQYYILAVPVIVMLLYAIVKWDAAQSDAESMKEKLCEIEGDKKNYESLLTKVRLRQHAFKNHMEAISSFHYIHKTDEKFVQLEEDYYRQLLKENKYNDLLLTGNDVLAGYLCRKFQDAEDDGIEIHYRITAEISQCRVPIYHVIEMLGILLDNATEAVKDMARKEIFFAVCEADDKYEFLIRNPFPYVPYEDIVGWFSLGTSEKGSGRGLGLYHLKCLCEEWNCDIGCRNMGINRENWIVFSLRIGKKI